MQYKNEKTLQLALALGKVINSSRKSYSSLLKLANEYDLDDTNLGRIEKGSVEAKLVTIWKVSEALGMKCSELIRLVEDELGEDFSIIDK